MALIDARAKDTRERGGPRSHLYRIWALRRRLVVVASLCCLAVSGSARERLPRATPESVGLASARLDQATRLLDQFVTDHKIAGAVAAVAGHGKLAYREAVGVQDLVTRAPMSESTLFRIYSMTKSGTAVLVMMLHEEGRFRLEDPITKYLSVFREARVVGAADATPRSLGRLVEIWSGKPFDEFLAERILRPLKMTDTVFTVESDRRARLATVYASAQGGGLAAMEIESLPFTEQPAILEGAVGLVSTVPDYLRFSQMLLNKGELEGARILKAETVARITVNGLPETVQQQRGAMGWGLANVKVVIDQASPQRGEYGWDSTAGTIFWVDPSREMITILMTQSAPSNPDGIRQKFKALVEQAVER